MFKKNERIFRTLTVDKLTNIEQQMAEMHDLLIGGIPETASGDVEAVVLQAMDRYSDLWRCHADKLDTLLDEFTAWQETQKETLRLLLDAKAERLQIRSDIDQKGDEVVQRLTAEFQKFQHATQGQIEDRDRKIERLQQKLADEAKHRQMSRVKSIGIRQTEKHFVDREAYLEQLTDSVLDPDSRLILVIGQGGIGKTALTTKFCDEIEKTGFKLLRGQFRQADTGAADSGNSIHAIVFVSKSEMIQFTIQELFDKLLRILIPADIERIESIIKDPKVEVARKTELILGCLPPDSHTLIVLDNFESMLTETEIHHDELRDFIETACRVRHSARFMLTSRRPVRLDFEDTMVTVPLDKGLEPAYAITLLRRLAEGQDRHAGIRQIQEATDDQLLRLVELVHGVPMALRSIAGFLKRQRRLTIDQVVHDAETFAAFQRHDFVSGLRKLIKEQYDSLPADHQLVLQALAAYNAPAPPVAVQFLLPGLDVEAVLDSLAFDYFLAQEHHDEFDLHPTVRDYAHDQIPDESDPGTDEATFTKTALHARAADFYAQLKKPESEWRSLADLQPHLDEFAQRVQAGQYERAARLLAAIDFHYLQLWGTISW